MHGWLNINKPLNYTSSRIITLLKKRFNIAKIGHTGTLDPLASGVLPIAIGEATKLAQYLVVSEKSYSFTIQFGEQKDTGDLEGKTIFSSNIKPSHQQLLDIEKAFIGNISQVPPIYSAIKVNGKRAYDLARAGEKFELQSRQITISHLKLVNYCLQSNQAQYIVHCSKGTYIRTLAEDIAKSLQTYGYVIELTRLQVGNFKFADAYKFDDLIKMDRIEFLSKLNRMDKVLDDIPVLEITDAQALTVRYGQQLSLNMLDHDIIWLKNDDKIVAIGKIINNFFHSSRVFNL